MSVANIASLASIQGKRVSLATTKLAKLAIFATDMLWESCLKFNLEQLSHSMSVANIASLAVARETYFPWIRAKLAIFATDMLWKSCSKFYFEHFCHNMFCQNIVSLVIIKIMKLYM